MKRTQHPQLCTFTHRPHNRAVVTPRKSMQILSGAACSILTICTGSAVPLRLRLPCSTSDFRFPPTFGTPAAQGHPCSLACSHRPVAAVHCRPHNTSAAEDHTELHCAQHFCFLRSRAAGRCSHWPL